MIHADDLHKAFGAKRVLRGVSFAVPKGQSLVVIGGSGSGKSVLLRCLLGLERADRGHVRIAGLDDPAPLPMMPSSMPPQPAKSATARYSSAKCKTPFVSAPASEAKPRSRRLRTSIHVAKAGSPGPAVVFPSRLPG